MNADANASTSFPVVYTNTSLYRTADELSQFRLRVGDMGANAQATLTLYTALGA